MSKQIGKILTLKHQKDGSLSPRCIYLEEQKIVFWMKPKADQPTVVVQKTDGTIASIGGDSLYIDFLNGQYSSGATVRVPVDIIGELKATLGDNASGEHRGPLVDQMDALLRAA